MLVQRNMRHSRTVPSSQAHMDYGVGSEMFKVKNKGFELTALANILKLKSRTISSNPNIARIAYQSKFHAGKEKYIKR